MEDHFRSRCFFPERQITFQPLARKYRRIDENQAPRVTVALATLLIFSPYRRFSDKFTLSTSSFSVTENDREDSSETIDVQLFLDRRPRTPRKRLFHSTRVNSPAQQRGPIQFYTFVRSFRFYALCVSPWPRNTAVSQCARAFLFYRCATFVKITAERVSFRTCEIFPRTLLWNFFPRN